jgi:hypothetical protein
MPRRRPFHPFSAARSAAPLVVGPQRSGCLKPVLGRLSPRGRARVAPPEAHQQQSAARHVVTHEATPHPCRRLSEQGCARSAMTLRSCPLTSASQDARKYERLPPLGGAHRRRGYSRVAAARPPGVPVCGTLVAPNLANQERGGHRRLPHGRLPHLCGRRSDESRAVSRAIGRRPAHGTGR